MAFEYIHESMRYERDGSGVRETQDSESNLNNAAYLLAAHDAFLDLAENWSERSIEIVEKELNNSAISNVQSSTWALVSRLSHYWDTLGWTMFRQGKTDAAQK